MRLSGRKSNRLLFAAIPIFCLIAFQPCYSTSQLSDDENATSIRLVGRVVDVLKLPLPGTTVTLTVPGANWIIKEVLTDEDGSFTIGAVPAKQYVIRCVAPGFKARAMRLEVPGSGDRLDVGNRRARNWRYYRRASVSCEGVPHSGPIQECRIHSLDRLRDCTQPGTIQREDGKSPKPSRNCI